MKIWLFFFSVLATVALAESGGTQLGADIDGDGHSVSMSSDGTRVAIGAPYRETSGGGTLSGHVRVYSESGGTWTQVGADIDGEVSGDRSGYSVSMSSDGTRVAIGAPYRETSGGGTLSGYVRVYSESGGTWTQVGADIDGEAANDHSGWSVSMSSDGTRVAIAAPYHATNAGTVRVYSESGGTWTQVGADIDSEAANDSSYGNSVSMSSDGTRVAIGADRNGGNGSNAGHVRVYAESGGTWTQVGADIDGEAANDRSGCSVSISSDGTRVAIGAERNDGNGADAGHVRLYSESGGTWTQMGEDIDGEVSGDRSGYSVSMSSDGTRVAIGAPYHETSAGYVRVHVACNTGYEGTNCTSCNTGYEGTNCQTASACTASSDSSKDGSDGTIYCINGGTVGGTTGSCTCTTCYVNEYVSSNACTTCPVGSANAAGDDATGSDTNCACAVDMYVSSNLCVACSTGHTRVEGDTVPGSDTACTPPAQTSLTVTYALTGYTEESFIDAEKVAFVAAIANLISTSPTNVRVISVTNVLATSRRRRLMQTVVGVDVEFVVDVLNDAVASSVGSQLDSLAATDSASLVTELKAQGLTSTTGVTLTTRASTSINTPPYSKSSSSSNMLPTIAHISRELVLPSSRKPRDER